MAPILPPPAPILPPPGLPVPAIPAAIPAFAPPLLGSLINKNCGKLICFFSAPPPIPGPIPAPLLGSLILKIMEN
jgi:hypothetical protein